MVFGTNTVIELKKEFIIELSELYEFEEAASIFFIILEHYAGMKRLDLALNPNSTLDSKQMDLIGVALTQLKQNKPVQQIIGVSHFFNLEFQLSRDVLIPRPETEELVDWILTDISMEVNQDFKILDIGTGSGCIPVCLKYTSPNITMHAIDVSEKALEVAGLNAQKHQVDIRFNQLDILNKEERSKMGAFDIIVSNPPYIKNSEKDLMRKNVLDHEPDIALFVSDEDPLLFYREIAEFALEHLNSKGLLYFEINEAHGQQMIEMLKSKGFTNIILKQDLFGKDRMMKAIRQ
ncbi:MAG: peptide chain release factor N(5)-glutamine methyltransferase [Bacteroidales bacterium]|nr:peptide chain release factor N(5)-glutamine methyltransferase [Bacteroidales bacterium]